MARGLNKVMIIGNVGSDPELRYMPNGNPVANFSVATTENWKDKQTGEKQERTEWHRLVMYNRLAEICGEYLRKGSKIYIEGSLRTRKWQDQAGVDKYMTEIIASEMQMLDGKGTNSGAGFNPANTGMQQNQQNNNQPGFQMGGQQQAATQQYQPPSQPAYQAAPQSAPSQQGFSPSQAAASPQGFSPSQAAAPAPVMDNFDDDVPF